MKTIKKFILTRNNEPTEEKYEIISKEYKGLTLKFEEAYYLDFEVDEDTGMINNDKLVKHYTKNQVTRNLKALKNAYAISKDSIDPLEILEFRRSYDIAASTLSMILGFSKNTISNIENEGVTSIPSGRFIKMALRDRKTLYRYIELSDWLDEEKRNDLAKRIAEDCV
jgi:transcriptional regulator with XRE-family HTH domain